MSITFTPPRQTGGTVTLSHGYGDVLRVTLDLDGDLEFILLGGDGDVVGCAYVYAHDITDFVAALRRVVGDAS